MDPRELRTSSNADLKASLEDTERALKPLIADLTECEVKATAVREDIARLTREFTAIKQEIGWRNRPAPVPKVSEHALLRYIERAHGIDLDALRSQILTPAVVSAIISGASGVTVNGIKLVIDGATIVTVVSDTQRQKKTDSARGRIVDASDAIADGLAEYEADKAEGRAA